ncbi:hypothetical protein ACR733_02770 [Bifidobacterium bifidum]|uniref:hypothetical protein n=1 Tax=Bifidobacterium bifidum TaxID=1681 RepID=UPI003DA2D293
MAKKKDSGLVQDALIPDEMSPLGLLDFNSSCAKIKQAAVDFRRAVNHKMQLETKDAYLDKFHQIDPYTEAVYDTDVLEWWKQVAASAWGFINGMEAMQ